MKQRILNKLEAIRLRKKGYSLNEIVEKLNVAKSSVSLWVRDVELHSKAKRRLLTRVRKGQLAARESKKRKIRQIMDNYFESASRKFQVEKLNPEISRAICAVMYWCEGAKNHYSGVRFTNSDPSLVSAFLHFFRKSFQVDETKFRVCVHLHKYHKKSKQLEFWSKVTKIKKDRFIKPFNKPNTEKRIRENYQGCISVYYHSNDMARQLLMTARAFLSKHGGVAQLAEHSSPKRAVVGSSPATPAGSVVAQNRTSRFES